MTPAEEPSTCSTLKVKTYLRLFLLLQQQVSSFIFTFSVGLNDESDFSSAEKRTREKTKTFDSRGERRGTKSAEALQVVPHCQ